MQQGCFAPFFPSQFIVVNNRLQNAISKELNNPKSSIGSAFSGEEISVIKNGSEAAAIAIFLSAVGVVVAAWWKRRNEGSEGRSEEESLLNQQQQ